MYIHAHAQYVKAKTHIHKRQTNRHKTYTQHTHTFIHPHRFISREPGTHCVIPAVKEYSSTYRMSHYHAQPSDLLRSPPNRATTAASVFCTCSSRTCATTCDPRTHRACPLIMNSTILTPTRQNTLPNIATRTERTHRDIHTHKPTIVQKHVYTQSYTIVYNRTHTHTHTQVPPTFSASTEFSTSAIVCSRNNSLVFALCWRSGERSMSPLQSHNHESKHRTYRACFEMLRKHEATSSICLSMSSSETTLSCIVHSEA
jgi:hypothetical protein